MLYFFHFMYPENDCTYKKKYSIVHVKKDISFRIPIFLFTRKCAITHLRAYNYQ